MVVEDAVQAEWREPPDTQPNQQLLPSLTADLVVRILSFNIETTMDIAHLRALFRGASAMIPASYKGNHQQIRVPGRRTHDESFPHELVRADGWRYDGDYMTIGERWTLNENRSSNLFHVFGAADGDDKFIVKDLTFLQSPTSYEESKKSFPAVQRDYTDQQNYLESYRDALRRVPLLSDPRSLSALVEDAVEKKFFCPVTMSPVPPTTEAFDGTETKTTRQWTEKIFTLHVSFEIMEGAACIKSLLDSRGATIDLDVDDGALLPAFAELTTIKSNFGAQVIMHPHLKNTEMTFLAAIFARDDGRLRGSMFLPVFCHHGMFYEYSWQSEPLQTTMVYDAVVEKHFQHTLVEGVAIVDGVVSPEFQHQLNEHINGLAREQERNGTVDYHPGSNQIVRDLVHPGLYSHVKDESPIRAQVNEVDTCVFPNFAEAKADDEEQETDYWGRPYESSIYQWLPTYFSIGQDGTCSIEDYINNLAPREHHSDLYASLAKLFQQALPYMESVYSYVRTVRPLLRESEEDELDFNEDEWEDFDMRSVSFCGRKLQVITKIVDYELKPGQAHSGVWHVEGMSHEEIVLTCLYVPYRDESIEGGDIRFQRAFLRDEAEMIFSGVSQMRHTNLEELIEKGLAPLGHVNTLEGRLIVFPNSHVHQVSTMVNHKMREVDDEDERTTSSDDDVTARRRIVVFFLVNPLKRIVSTREVAPQQMVAGGAMTLDQALHHRLELMRERKHHKQDWNVREIELCEH